MVQNNNLVDEVNNNLVDDIILVENTRGKKWIGVTVDLFSIPVTMNFNW